MEDDASSSIYTTDSPRPSMSLHETTSVDTTTSTTDARQSYNPSPSPKSPPRRHAYTPSYMSYQNRSSLSISTPRPVSQPIAVPQKPSSQQLLLVAIAGEPQSSTVASIRTALKKNAYSAIAVIGSEKHGVEMKQLKMDIYGLIGKLGSEVAVQVYCRNDWTESEVSAAVQESVGSAYILGGVMCYPACKSSKSGSTDILEVSQSELEESWRNTVGFVHAVAKQTLPQLKKPEESERTKTFMLMDSNGASEIGINLNKTACEALLTQLKQTHSAATLEIGSSKDLLTSEPEPAEPLAAPSLEPAESSNHQTSDFGLSESPTKMWNMWALQDQLQGN